MGAPTALWEKKWTALAMLSAGLIISAAWIGIAVHGWRAMRHHVEVAGSFASDCFNHLPNPFGETISAQAAMHRLVLLIIAVFILMYLGLALVRFS